MGNYERQVYTIMMLGEMTASTIWVDICRRKNTNKIGRKYSRDASTFWLSIWGSDASSERIILKVKYYHIKGQHLSRPLNMLYIAVFVLLNICNCIFDDFQYECCS